MKTIKILSFLALSTLFVNFGFGQGTVDVELPEKVTAAIALQYPYAKIGKWNYNANSQWYAVSFKLEEKKFEGYYTREGSWIKTQKKIKKLSLPQAVINSLQNSEHAGWEIMRAEEHQTPVHAYLYEVEVRSGKQEIYLYFLPDGKLVESVIKK